MPVLRQVAKTDNLEVQRQKINLLAQDLFDLTGGNSTVGFDKLSVSDGSTASPSITFTSDDTLGIFKISPKTLGISSNDTLIQTFSDTGIYTRKDSIFRKTTISSAGLSLSSGGSNYDPGLYTNVSLSGGNGTGCIASLNVISFTASISNPGSGYSIDDAFNNIPLTGGFGNGISVFVETDSLGSISLVGISSYGSGYQSGDVLSLPTEQSNVSTDLLTSSTQITVESTAFILEDSTVSQTGGTGSIAPGTTVLSILSSTELELSDPPISDGTATLTFTPPYGNGSGFSYTIDAIGVVDSVTPTSFGNGYSISDILSVQPTDLTQKIVYPVKSQTVNVVTILETISVAASGLLEGDTLDVNGGAGGAAIIEKINSVNGNISSIIFTQTLLVNGDTLVKTGTVSPVFTVDTSTDVNQFYINTGSGYTLTPDLLLYSGNIYEFDLTDASNSGNSFAISQFPDGSFDIVDNISSTVSVSTQQITVSSTSGIKAGMLVNKLSGNGVLNQGTTVLSIDSETTLTLSSLPLVDGSIVLSFNGYEYTDAVVRVSNTSLTVKPNSFYPSNLYYYAIESQNAGGMNENESDITINQNNPKTFGSGFQSVVTSVDSSEPIKAEILTGNFKAVSFEGSSATISSISSSGSSSFNNLSATSFNTASILSTSTLSIDATGYNINTLCDNFYIGSNIFISGSSGNINSSSVIKTTGSFNSNDQLTITGNTVSSAFGYNLVLSPFDGQVAKITGTTALTVPAGTTLERPALTAEAGSIRYNTTTGQFEGYSGLNWSSLGGVRDIDGDTFILAETSAGANNNTLYFYTGGVESTRFNSSGVNFVNTGTSNISSLSLQGVLGWQASTSYSLNSLIFSGSNVYQITVAGTTGNGSAPTHTSGSVIDGTAELTWIRSSAGSLNFTNCSKVSFSVPAEYGGDLRISNNSISSLINDVVISPVTGKKVKIDGTTSLVIPSGDSSERGLSEAGGIRFNTFANAFEGYTGSAWTSLGGIRDVDGNTYIIPELSAGSNENILYFYNDNDNTLRVSKTELTFDTIDTITSVNDNLDINVSTITFDSLSASLSILQNDTKLSTTKTNLDFGLSVGLTDDTLIRLNASGEIYVNTEFSLGSFNGTRLLDKTLKNVELSDLQLQTISTNLIKGTNNFAEFVIYNPSDYYCAKVSLSSLNTTVNQKHVVDYTVTDDSSDIFKVEYGELVTNNDIFSTSFDYDNSGNVRITVTLTDNVSAGDNVLVKIVKTLIKS